MSALGVTVLAPAYVATALPRWAVSHVGTWAVRGKPTGAVEPVPLTPGKAPSETDVGGSREVAMSVHVPVRCETCKAPLVIHCGSHTCAWLRCPNARCVWTVFDVERGVRVHRDGHVEGVKL